MAKDNNGTGISRPSNGIITDTSPADQPKDTARYVLNGTEQTDTGDVMSKTNMESNEHCGSVSPGFFILTSVYMGDNTWCVFSVNPVTGVSEIGILDRFCNYTAQVTSSCLGFEIGHQIDAKYRLRKGCEHTVYFSNGKLNPVRYVNFSKLDALYSEDYADFLLADGNPAEYTGEKWDCNKFNLIAPYKIPSMVNAEVFNGGAIPPGTLNFCIAYLDADLNQTNWIYSSQLVSIYHDTQSSPYENIIGSSTIEADALGGRETLTNKAVKITLANLDNQFPYYRIGIIEASSFTGEVTRVLSSPPVSIDNTEFIYSGQNSGYAIIPKEDIFVKRSDYEFAEHIEQLENRLILSAVSGKQINWCGFQKYASKIASKYVVKEISATNQNIPGNVKCPNTYWEAAGYMGDEVYAKGIVYVFTNGLESPAFHIPGRPKNNYWNFDTQLCESTDDIGNITWSEDLLPWFDNYDAFQNYDGQFPKYKVEDTSVRYGPEEGDTYGAMQYHENETHFYDKRDGCSGEDFWGLDCCGNPLTGTPVRHHKFPSRSKEPLLSDGVLYEGEVGLYLTITVKEGETAPAGTVTFIVDFENPVGTPQSITVTLDTNTDIPVYNSNIYTFSGDIRDLDIAADAYSGTVVDDYSAIFDYRVDIKEASQNITDGTILRVFGVEFGNIEYPHPDIVGHYFVRADRDTFNRTVLDKGIFGRLRTGTPGDVEYHTFSYFTRNNNDPRSCYFFNPEFLYMGNSSKPDYIKSECKFLHAQTTVLADIVDDPDYLAITGKETDVVIEARQYTFNGVATLPGHNYKIKDTVVLDGVAKDTFINPGAETYNLSWDNKVQIATVENDLPYSGEDIFYCSMKIEREVHPVLSAIVYYRTHNSMLTLNSSQLVFGGDTFITPLNLSNGLWRKSKKGIGVLIWSIIGMVVLAVASVFAPVGFIGIALAAAGIAAAAVNAIVSAYDNSNLDEMADDDEIDDGHGRVNIWNGHVFFANEFLKGIYVESSINTGLRQRFFQDCGDFFRNQSNIMSYYIDKWTYKFKEGSDARKRRGVPCPENYHYNKDYSRQNRESVFFPIPISYDCCSDCLEDHPSRSAYSEQSFQEELTDNYRIFLPNNYRDIEGELGRITDTFTFNSRLYLITTEALWELPANYQERVSNEIVSYIGTGEFFSIPPKKIIDTETGGLGTKHKQGTLKTPAGVCIVSELDRAVYLLSENGPMRITDTGNTTWFRNNMKVFFDSQFAELTGTAYPFSDNPANIAGTGFCCGYDHTYKKLFITKKDYLILEGKYSQTPAAGKITWNSEEKKFQTLSQGNVLSDVPFTNKDYFQNKSWTVSFSGENNRYYLSSWHSFIPDSYISSPDFMYSVCSDERIWKHNVKGSYGSYYGIRYPYILEYVLNGNSLETQIWDFIILQLVARKYDISHESYRDIRDIFFDKVIMYNSRQSTGELKLTVKSTEQNAGYLANQIISRPGEIIVNRTERDWCINDIRDYRTDYLKPIFTESWESLKSVYPIDKVIDTDFIDFNKDWTQLENMRDKFLIVRFIFDNLQDVQLLMNYNIDISTLSYR